MSIVKKLTVGVPAPSISITEDTTLVQHYNTVEVDLTTTAPSSTTVLRLGNLALNSFIKNKIMVIARIDKDATKKLRLAGTNTNFAEEMSSEDFTILTQTVSSPASGNTLTASADVSGDVKLNDTILVGDIGSGKIFTVANVAANIITTNETITTSYSSAFLSIGGLFIAPEDSEIIYGRTNDIWRGV